MKSRLPIASLLLLALVASARLIPGPAVAGQSRTSPFFSEVPTGGPGRAIDSRQDTPSIRRRLVRADLSLLTPADRVSGLPMRFAPSVDLNLFDDHAAAVNADDAPVTIRPPQLSVPSPAKLKWLTKGR